MRIQRALLHLRSGQRLLLGRYPAGGGLAVEQQHPTGVFFSIGKLVIGGEGGRGQKRKQDGKTQCAHGVILQIRND
jgi:hypothetical protein